MKLCACLVALLPASSGNLLWPLGSGFVRYPLRATYGQLEGEDYSDVDLHYGLDVAAKKASEPVYALETGTVVKVETDEGYYSGLVIESAQGESFLYLHLEGSTIPWNKNDEVQVDDYLGDVVYRDDVTGVRHLHLSRLKETNHLWVGLDRWSTRNPLKLIDPTLLGDDADPVIGKLDGAERFAARPNEDPSTTTTPDYQRLDHLDEEKLDVLALVHDLDGSSLALPLAPFRIELTVDGGSPFVIELDGSLRAFENEENALYNLDDEYASSGEEFYFVTTNGGSPIKPANAWSARKGTHTLHVRVYDVAGREKTHERTVEVE